jgi:uncharacterized Zn-binding protein involved in type VI secretion
MTPYPVSVTSDKTDIYGNGKLSGPPGILYSIGTYNVLAHGKPVLTVNDGVTPHGNYQFPQKPGYNLMCGKSKIATGNPRVLVNNKPIAFIGPTSIGSKCICGHNDVGPGAITVVVGG